MIYGLKKKKAEALLEIKKLSKFPEINAKRLSILKKRYEFYKRKLRELV